MRKFWVKGQVMNRGESNPSAKLTAEQAYEIRRRRRAGERGTKLAKEFGVQPSCVCKIFKGLIWVETP